MTVIIKDKVRRVKRSGDFGVVVSIDADGATVMALGRGAREEKELVEELVSTIQRIIEEKGGMEHESV